MMSGFFEEVKRRKVYRVAVAYVIAAGFIIQVGSAVFPAWELPGWTLKLVIVLLLIGFPIALIFAWAFDVTSEGIKTTPPVVAEAQRPARGRRNLIVLLTLGVFLSAIAGFFLLPRVAARKIDKSIAVLPFENFSKEEENAFFADGIQDDILTNLSKIGDLKVISRTSVMGYRGKAPNIREIGKTLGVSTILEGSVRREGNRVRVTVQLINATNDEHIWGNNYDRDLTDVFAIQTDLAREIAQALHAKLSPTEKAQIESKPTQNSEAYLVYVQAHNLHGEFGVREKIYQAEELYEKAIRLDQNFALAYASLSHLESWIYHSYDPLPARRNKARAMADRALQLQPNMPEGHLALGFCYYYGELNYEAALKEFAIAQRGLPNHSDVYLAIGAIQRRQGRWAESTANMEKAASLNPNDTWPLQNLAINYEMTRNFTAAFKTLDRGLKIDPKSLSLWSLKAQWAISDKGDFSVAEKALAVFESQPLIAQQKAEIAAGRVNLLFLQRDFAGALREISKVTDETTLDYGKLAYKYLIEGIARRKLQDEAGARTAFLKGKEIAERNMREAPEDPERHAHYAQVLACLGEKDAAIAEAKRATELRPESLDALDGPAATETLAAVYAIVGEHDKAIELLEGLLVRPSGLTITLVKLSPIWDPLRDNPRFKDLIQKYSAKT